MNHTRPISTPSTHPRWEETTPMPRLEPLAASAAAGPQIQASRLQQQVQGLEVRELEGQTIFDQLFGSAQR